MLSSIQQLRRILVKTYGDNGFSEKKQAEDGFNNSIAVFSTLKMKNILALRKNFEDTVMEASLEEDTCQTQEELAETLGVDQSKVSRRSKLMGMIQKQRNWVP